ncbi:hypothetical protein V1477_003707 [Vespula maculifrons]|uniref:Uncharacterized protein n=1 Tax=Vespula maculifrons TaxID=7453 RepID=A0ABD2CRT6_VESMC
MREQKQWDPVRAYLMRNIEYVQGRGQNITPCQLPVSPIMIYLKSFIKFI